MTGKVTIVDDDPSVLRALGRLCRSAGHAVQAFGSAEAFLDAEAGVQVECLVLDVHLPGMSGLELQTRLAELGRRDPIIFISAFENEHQRRLALEAGARAFLSKPLDSALLLGVITEALEARSPGAD